MATAEDFGDYLLNNGKVSQEDYNNKQMKAKKILNQESDVKEDVKVDRNHHVPFSVAMSVYKSDNSRFF